MKQRLLSILFMLYLVLPIACQAGEMRQITLIDNSIIVGEVLSMRDGIYTVKTDNLGLLKIADSKVKSIGIIASRTTESVDASNLSGIAGITQKMTADSTIMQQILALQNDPDFQEILQDEAVMRAINSGDLSALMNNPKIIKLIENPSVQKIGKEVQ